MKKTTTKSVAMIVFSIAVSQGAFANWTAFNDIDVYPGDTVYPNITTFGSGESGLLVKNSDGTDTSVTLAISTFSDGGILGTADPDSGTDAYNEFNGYVGFDGYTYGDGSGFTLTLSGLDPTASYTAVLFGNRGGNYTDRYTEMTLGGADSFVNDSSAGAVLSTVAAANDTTRIMVGHQTDTGQVFKYSAIDAGADGTITLTIPDGDKNYLNTFKLTEAVPEPGTLGLVAVFGGSILFIRRRLKR